MAKKKRCLGRVLYTLFLALWAALLCYGVYYGLDKVWTYAEAYEASRPNHTMDAYVADLSRNLWDEGIADTIKAMPHEVQSDEEVGERVREMLSDGISYSRKSGGGAGRAIISYSRKSGGGAGRAIYSLRCRGNEFGTVTIAEAEDFEPPFDMSRFPWTMLPWSIKPWHVESETFDFGGLYSSVEIVIPRTFHVLLDGLPTKIRYRFDNIIGSIDPVILDEDGEVFVVDPNRDDAQFIKPCSPEKLERLAQFTAGFVERYLRYTSGVVDPTYGYQRLQPYLLGGGDLDKRMHDALDGLHWAHTSSVNVDAATLNGALALGDNHYILDITSIATTYTNGKGEAESVSNMRVIVRERNDDIRAIFLELY